MGLKERIKPFPENKTKVYATITGSSKIDDENYLVTFDLINGEILKIDTELYGLYFSKNNECLNKIDLKEYLFTYFMTIEMKLKDYENEFKEFREDLLYEIEIIPTNKRVEEDSDLVFESFVHFSASPIERVKFFSSFTGLTFPLKTTPLSSLGISPIANQSDIKKALDNVFTYELKVDKFRVHRVGQGSCNSIIFKLQSEKKLFYDIGISKYSNTDEYYNVYIERYSMFNMNNFDAVIISHWDEDHYMGIYLENCRNLLNKKWITPPIQENCFNAKRLAFLISVFGEIRIIDDSVQGLFYKKDDMYLFKGDGTGKNNSGIMLCLNNSMKNLVAMGDVSYKNASFIHSHSVGIFSIIDHLIVPHHGAYFSHGNPFTPKNQCSTAIISVGYNGCRTHHPNQSTITDLSAAGFTVYRTDLNERQIVKF